MSDAISHATSQILDNPVLPVIGTAVAGAVLALWIAAAWWAYSDAQRRTDSTLAGLIAAGWVAVSTPLLLPLSLAIYTLARPQQTAAEHRTRDLAAELVGLADRTDASHCPGCLAAIDAVWLRCPACATWLAAPCAGCGAWSAPALAICPWCGSEQRDEPAVEQLEPAVTSRSRRHHRSRRSPRAVGPGAPGPRPLPRRQTAVEGRPLAPLRGQ